MSARLLDSRSLLPLFRSSIISLGSQTLALLELPPRILGPKCNWRRKRLANPLHGQTRAAQRGSAVNEAH